jgi:hypothetical protein
LSPIKGLRPPHPVSCHSRAAAGAIDGSRGELQVRPAAHQNKLSLTFPGTHSGSPTFPSRRRDPYLAGAGAPAVVTGRRRGTPPPGTPPPPIPVQIAPRCSPNPSPHVLWPNPSLERRNLSRRRRPPWPGATMQGVKYFQGPPRKSISPIVLQFC